MGKPTGFLEFQRISESYEKAATRIQHYREFIPHLSDDQARTQGARCMDCGIPFCNNGCPVNNLIPDWNDLVYKGKWQEAITTLHSTNNFPEFTSRICPAPCEAACTLNIPQTPVGIKSIERAIIDKAGENGWVVPQPAAKKTGKKIAIVGSGPAGLAAAQQLARVGHAVTVFEKNDRIGGLLRYGIPDFKLDKRLIDWRMAQMKVEGVKFVTGTMVTGAALPKGIVNDAKKTVSAGAVAEGFRCRGAGRWCGKSARPAGSRARTQGRAFRARVPHSAEQGSRRAAEPDQRQGQACARHRRRRHRLRLRRHFESPRRRQHHPDRTAAASARTGNGELTWPYWPLRMRTSSSHDEGCARDWAIGTKEFIGENGVLKAVKAVRLEWKDGRMSEIAGSEFEIPADYVFLAMGFVSPVGGVLDAFGIDKDNRGNAKRRHRGRTVLRHQRQGVFAAGDMRRGQSLVVWAIREGRQCARSVDQFLMGSTTCRAEPP
jgi:glutamate synthase (NADPH/NADH) small chain